MYKTAFVCAHFPLAYDIRDFNLLGDISKGTFSERDEWQYSFVKFLSPDMLYLLALHMNFSQFLDNKSYKFYQFGWGGKILSKYFSVFGAFSEFGGLGFLFVFLICFNKISS